MTKPKPKRKPTKAPAKPLARRAKSPPANSTGKLSKTSARIAKAQPRARAARAKKPAQLDPRTLAAIAMALEAEAAAEQRKLELAAPPSPWTSGGRLRRMQHHVTR